MLARAPAGGVVVDPMTAAAIGPWFELGAAVEAEGATFVPLGAERPSRRALLGRAMPCFGRETELRAMSALQAAAIDDSQPRGALITAAPGAGKTRLRDEILDRFSSLPHAPLVIALELSEERRAAPLATLAAILRAAIGIRPDDPRSIVADRASAIVRAIDPTRSDLGVLIAAVLAPDVESEGSRDVTSVRDRARYGFLELLRMLLRRQPVTIVLDDAQWIDGASAQILDALWGQASELPLCLLLFGRPDLDVAIGNLRQRPLQRLPLRPLGPRAASELVRAALGEPAEEHRVRAIVDAAEGNVFHLEELVRAEAFRAAGDAATPLPAALSARVARLPASGRRALRAASIVGQSFWSGAVAALLPPDDDAAGILSALVDAELIVRGGASRFAGELELEFHHGFVRQAAYETLVPEDRARGHALIGEWLEAHREPDAVAIATHFELGGVPARAVRHLVEAAERSLLGSDSVGARTLAERAVTYGGARSERAAARRILSDVARWEGAMSEALEHAEAALADADPGTAGWYAAATEVVLASQQTAHGERIAELGDAILAPATPGAEEDRLVALIRTRAATSATGNAEATARIHEAIELARSTLDPRDARTHAWLAVFRVEMATGDVVERYLAEVEAKRHFVRLGDLRRVVKHLVNLAAATRELGDWDASWAGLEEADLMANEIGLTAVQNYLCMGRGTTAYDQGRYEVALDEHSRALADADPSDVYFASLARAEVALSQIAFGDLAAARRIVAELRPLAPEIDFLPIRVETLVALVELAADRPIEALAAATRALEGSRALGEHWPRIAFEAYVNALVALGDVDRARDVARAYLADVEATAARIADLHLRACYLAIGTHQRLRML